MHCACAPCTVNEDKDALYMQCRRKMHLKEHGIGAMYDVSALTEALYTSSVHCQNTHRCIVHMQCTLDVHITCAVYAVSALNDVQ